jgi:RNA polymerase sigma-70 factor (ECF subfamily)
MGRTTRRELQSKVMDYPHVSEAPTAATNEDLMTLVQQGDMNAYQELIRLYQKKVFRVISSYQRNPEDAMEVLQDTFLKVYTARSTWERRTSFGAWLYRIAINASIDRHRRAGKARPEYLEDMVEAQIHRSATTTVPRNPLDRLKDEERRAILERAIRRLPDRQREIVSLRYFAEMQLEEIASTLNCPLGTVKSNLHKAINALKSLLLDRKEVLNYG